MALLERPRPMPGGLVISPHGDKIAYHLRTKVSTPEEHPPRYTSSIWISDVGQIHSACQITHGPFDDHKPQWSTDGTFVLFMSDRHAREKDGRATYQLYRLWPGVDALPASLLVRWPFTQFCPWMNKFIVIEQNGPHHFEQRTADARWLRPQKYSECAIYGHGHVTMLAPCLEKGDTRVAMLVVDWTRLPIDPPYPAPPTRERSVLWLGGHGNPYPIPVSKTQKPRNLWDPPFPFSISHIGWAGSTLFFLSNDSCEIDGSSFPMKPAIYRMGGEQPEGEDRDEVYSRVYGGEGHEGHILSISSAGDDLLVHERDAEGEERLHLLHAGRTLWKQKETIVEAVATKPQNGAGPVFVAIISSVGGEDQTVEAFSIVAATESTGLGDRVQLSDHCSAFDLMDTASSSFSLPFRPRGQAPVQPVEDFVEVTATPTAAASANQPTVYPYRRWAKYKCPFPTAEEVAADKERERQWRARFGLTE
ncbi:hypothetical protein SEUCBS139899_001972 [Sporothrix eucalyptigena]